MVAEGQTVFMDNCAACHGESGEGDIYQGAPNLADAIWLYGGSFDTIKETVTYSRFGVMPPMGGADLSEAEIRAVAIYVHQLAVRLGVRCRSFRSVRAFPGGAGTDYRIDQGDLSIRRSQGGAFFHFSG